MGRREGREGKRKAWIWSPFTSRSSPTWVDLLLITSKIYQLFKRLRQGNWTMRMWRHREKFSIMNRVKFRSRRSKTLFDETMGERYQAKALVASFSTACKLKLLLAFDIGAHLCRKGKAEWNFLQVRSVTSETLLHADSLSYDTLVTLAGTNNLGSVRNLTIRLRLGIHFYLNFVWYSKSPLKSRYQFSFPI